ncbi:MAG: hypothetical protein ACLQG3_12950 [Terracidiphilus sp.]
MPRRAKNRKFANEAEEAAWWKANEEAFADALEKRIADGYRGPVKFAITGDSTVVKIRLSGKDVVLASQQAKKRGLRCQEYLRSILHEALQKRRRIVKSSTS